MKRILILPGDGIGAEVCSGAERVLEALIEEHGLEVEVEHGLIGGASIEACGAPLSEAALRAAHRADAVLLGAVGGPQWDDLPLDQRPEKGLLQLRSGLDLFANLRPATVFPELIGASSLRPEFIEGLNLLIVRELAGGIYFGEPRGLQTDADGGRTAFNTCRYSEAEIERIARFAFAAARRRSGRLCSIDKANVLEVTRLWREVFTRIGAEEFPDIELSHLYVDNAAMQLVSNPKQFDVIAADNLFGDILSDQAAELTGSLGMLPSASLNDGSAALYEPCHGSAPDIAGTDSANPLAMILSLGLLLRYSLDRADLADRIDRAVAATLAEGIRTRDIAVAGETPVGCTEMAEHVRERCR
ncbi:MAG: 3-isopropylmalate dehydrogenase [Gammaproteobacteria bacterium AqS3]|nr:3-isopropylmalate dehydrogenase [Gammaproteobacteria bacterium AqS3]